MRFLFTFQISVKQLWSNRKSSVIIFISLSVCIAAILLLMESLLYSTSFLKNVETYKRTYNLNMSSYTQDYESTYQLVDELLFGTQLPEISQINYIQAAPLDNTNVREYIVAEIYLEENDRYAPVIEINEGRLFSEEEMSSGENVIILSCLENHEIGDKVQLNQVDYTVVGLCDGIYNYIPFENVLKNQQFTLCVNSIEFRDKLSKEQEKLFFSIAADANSSPFSLYSKDLGAFVIQTITDIVIMLLIAYCAMSIIAQLFQYMVESRMYEFNIYKTLGIGNLLLFAFFYLPICIITLFANAAGCLIYYLSEPLQAYIRLDEQLSIGIVAILCMLMLVILFFTTVPIYLRLRRSLPIESR